MKQEYRVAYTREGGHRQYRTFQLEKNLDRYVESLVKGTRPELKPIVHLECVKRTVGVWYTHRMPGDTYKDENLSHPDGMINERRDSDGSDLEKRV